MIQEIYIQISLNNKIVRIVEATEPPNILYEDSIQLANITLDQDHIKLNYHSYDADNHLITFKNSQDSFTLGITNADFNISNITYNDIKDRMNINNLDYVPYLFIINEDPFEIPSQVENLSDFTSQDDVTTASDIFNEPIDTDSNPTKISTNPNEPIKYTKSIRNLDEKGLYNILQINNYTKVRFPDIVSGFSSVDWFIPGVFDKISNTNHYISHMNENLSQTDHILNFLETESNISYEPDINTIRNSTDTISQLVFVVSHYLAFQILHEPNGRSLGFNEDKIHFGPPFDTTLSLTEQINIVKSSIDINKSVFELTSDRYLDSRWIYYLGILLNKMTHEYSVNDNTISVADSSSLALSTIPPDELAKINDDQNGEAPKIRSYQNENLKKVLFSPLSIGKLSGNPPGTPLADTVFTTTLKDLRENNILMSATSHVELQASDIVYAIVEPITDSNTNEIQDTANIAATYYHCPCDSTLPPEQECICDIRTGFELETSDITDFDIILNDIMTDTTIPNIFLYNPLSDGWNIKYRELLSDREFSLKVYLKYLMNTTSDRGLVHIAYRIIQDGIDGRLYHNFWVRYFYHFINTIPDIFFNGLTQHNHKYFKFILYLLCVGELERNYTNSYRKENCYNYKYMEKGVPHHELDTGRFHYSMKKYIDEFGFNYNDFKNGHGVFNLLGSDYIAPITAPFWSGPAFKYKNIENSLAIKLGFIGTYEYYDEASEKYITKNTDPSAEFRAFWNFAEDNGLFIPPALLFNKLTNPAEYFECPLVWAPILITYLRNNILNYSKIRKGLTSADHILPWYMLVNNPDAVSDSYINNTLDYNYLINRANELGVLNNVIDGVNNRFNSFYKYVFNAGSEIKSISIMLMVCAGEQIIPNTDITDMLDSNIYNELKKQMQDFFSNIELPVEDNNIQTYDWN